MNIGSSIVKENSSSSNYENTISSILIKTISDGIIAVDLDWKIIYMNPAAVNLLDLSADEAIGKKLWDYIETSLPRISMQDQKMFPCKIASNGEEIECSITPTDSNIYLIAIRKNLSKPSDVERKYQRIIELSAEGIIIINPMGEIAYANPSFRSLVGYEYLKGKLFRTILSDESIYIFQEVFLEARSEKKQITNIEIELLHRNREIIPVELSLSPFIEDEKFSYMICSLHDLRDRKKLEEELRKSEKLKTEFMNIAAHELKSPITPVKGYLELIISDEEASERIKNWAKISLRNAERLLLLINDILDIARLESDTMRFNMKQISIANLLKEIVEDVKQSIEDKQLDFIVEIPEDLPSIIGDPDRLSQVFKNLITNAIKFTDRGSITLSAKKNKNNIEIYVRDTGIGIPKGELNNIFKKFYQVDMKEKRIAEGTGLGLYICKEIVEKHNGSIHVESSPGEGSTFIITLPTSIISS